MLYAGAATTNSLNLRYLLEDDLDSAEQVEVPEYISELKSLAALRDDGIITEEEFQKQKTEILRREEAQ